MSATPTPRSTPPDQPAPLLPIQQCEQLREALGAADYTVDGVSAAFGLAGAAALGRADLVGARRTLRGDGGLQTLIRLFMLGLPQPLAIAQAALGSLSVRDAQSAGLLRESGGEVLAAVDMRPYGEDDPVDSLVAGWLDGTDAGPAATRGADGDRWWVVSDLGSDVRPGPLRPDHVLGIGSAATTLAQSTMRPAVQRALDVGTGCGVQSLHLSRHAASITATDLSRRALQMAATTAALSGLNWDLRHGDLLAPVADEQFDLIVANPPFIVGPGWGTDAAGARGEQRSGFDYRDSGSSGDALCERLIRQLPARLAPGGAGQMLANWIIPSDGDWQGRIDSWLTNSGCDGWIWQREVAELGEYAALWLRDAGETPGTPTWAQRYEQWMDWFEANGVLAVGMGLISLRRTDAAHPTVVYEDVPQAVEQPVGPHIASWFERASWLRDAGVDIAVPSDLSRLFDARLRAADDLSLTTHALNTGAGWEPATHVLRQMRGMRWELESDDAIASLVAGCAGELTLGQIAGLLAAGLDAPVHAVRAGLGPTVIDLIRRGFLLPA